MVSATEREWFGLDPAAMVFGKSQWKDLSEDIRSPRFRGPKAFAGLAVASDAASSLIASAAAMPSTSPFGR
jgi:hypothetical protein